MLAGIPLARRAERTAAAVTVVDRDTGLHQLDERLYPFRSTGVRWALSAASAGDGAHWVLRATAARADAPREILLIDEQGVVQQRRAVDGVQRIALCPSGAVQWLEERGAARLWMRWRPPAAAHVVGAAWCWTALDGDFAGDALGGLWKQDGADLARLTTCSGAVAELRVLDDGVGLVLEGGGRRAVRLDRRLVERSSTALAPDEFVIWLEDGAFACDPQRARLSRLDAAGRRVRVREDPELLGVTGGVAFPGGVLLAAPGALLHYDSQGRRRPGQGGFRRLVGAPLYSRATSSAAAASVFPSFSPLPSTSDGLMRSTSSSSSASWSSPPPGTATSSSAR